MKKAIKKNLCFNPIGYVVEGIPAKDDPRRKINQE